MDKYRKLNNNECPDSKTKLAPLSLTRCQKVSDLVGQLRQIGKNGALFTASTLFFSYTARVALYKMSLDLMIGSFHWCRPEERTIQSLKWFMGARTYFTF